MEKNPEDDLWDLVHKVDATFKRDDIKSVSRKVLEDLVVRLYDGIKDVIQSYPEWWERES